MGPSPSAWGASVVANSSEPGLDLEIVNAGRIATEATSPSELRSAWPGLDLSHAADGEIVNRGVIETEGDGAAGVVMIGDGHHLTNSGRITTDGGDFDGDALGHIACGGRGRVRRRRARGEYPLGRHREQGRGLRPPSS